MSRLSTLFVAALLAAWLPAAAHAQCPGPTDPNPLDLSTADSRTYAESWSVLEILWRAANEGWTEAPEAWERQDAQRTGATTDGELDAHWQAAVAWAVEQFGAFAASCSDEDVRAVASHLFASADPETVVREQAEQGNPTARGLAEMFGPVGPVPAPKTLQLALSQVVSGGQPGFAPSVSGTPGARSDNVFLRHFGIAASALVLQPTREDAAGGASSPLLASFEGGFTFSSRPTAYDWFRALALATDDREDFEDGVRVSAVRTWLREFQRLRAAGATKPDALRASALEAQRVYHDATESWIRQRFVRPEHVRRDVEVAAFLRGRYTPHAEFVPEVADLLSIAASAAVTVPFTRDVSRVGVAFDASLQVALSGWSTSVVQSSADANGDNLDLVLLIDSALGFSLILPGDSGPSILSGSFVIRGSRRDLRDNDPAQDFSAGGSFALQVPVTDIIGLVGTYAFRCAEREGADCATTAGITFAAELVE